MQTQCVALSCNPACRLRRADGRHGAEGATLPETCQTLPDSDAVQLVPHCARCVDCTNCYRNESSVDPPGSMTAPDRPSLPAGPTTTPNAAPVPPPAYATPTIPKNTGEYMDGIVPPPPPPSQAQSNSLFAHASQPNIARNAPLIISRSLIEQNPAQAAGVLITLLSSSVSGELQLHPTTAEERRAVVLLMREVGTPVYLKSFSGDIRGREILATWLSDATPPRKADVADESEKWKDVLCPLLELLLQLPIELDHLKDHVGLGKLITGVQKRARNEKARALADAVKEKWSKLVPVRSSSEARDSPPVAPKRPAANTPTESVKRARSTTPPARSSAPAAAQTAASKPPAGTARPASSLLQSTSVSRTRATPTERKASPQLSEPRIPTRAAAKPTAAADPLATARRAQRNAPASNNANKDLAGFMSLIEQQPTPSAPTASETPSTTPMERKKRKKAVHWKDYDGMPLVAVKLIEPAVYEDDGDLSSVSGIGALDMEEGGAFRQAHAEMDEQIDWYTPCELSIPDPESGPLPPRGSDSQAKVAQEEREKAVLLAVYMNLDEIPASPEEPDEFVLAFANSMPEPRPMTTGLPGEPAPVSASAAPDVPPMPDFSAMAAMLGQMNAANGEGPPVPPMPPMPMMPFDPMMLQSLVQSTQGNGSNSPNPGTPPMPMPPWAGGMPGFPFPFPPPPEMMAQMGMPVPDNEPTDTDDGAKSRKVCRYYKAGERYV